jgi:hypothetical protein
MSTSTAVPARTSRSTQRSRSHKAQTRPAPARPSSEPFAYGSNEGDHTAIDRVVSSYLASHRQNGKTLGNTTLFDLMNWSNSRCKWPNTPAAIPAATTANATTHSRTTASQRKQATGETPATPQATDDSKGKPRSRAAGA